jgi:hypothetical protein
VKARASEIETLLDSLASLSLSDSGIQSVEAYTLDSGRRASVGERVLTLPGEAGIDLGKTRQGYVTLTEPTTGTVVSVKDFGFYEIDFGKFSGQVKGDKLMRMVDYRKITGISDVEEKANDKFEDIKGVISQDYYYRDMPSPRSSSETGSDGNYELTVEGGVPYYLIAQASRSVGDDEEQYYWMVKTTVEGGGEKELNLTNKNLGGVASKKYALSERTLSTVKGIWESSISLAKEGEELDWKRLIYRTAFPDDTTDAPIPDDLDVPEDELLSDR